VKEQQMMKKTIAVGVLAASAVPVTSSMVLSPAPDDRGRSPLAGAWQVVISPTNGQPFVNINTFDTHGQIVNVDPVFGTGVGSSYRTGAREFQVVFHGFNDERSRFKANGTLTLNGRNSFSGVYVTEIYDLNGNFMFAIEGTLAGHRL
jgi:hypothetical protein